MQTGTQTYSTIARLGGSRRVFLVGAVLLSVVLGAGIAFLGPVVLVVPLALFALLVDARIVVVFILLSLTVDLTWLSGLMRFVPELLVGLLLLRSMPRKGGVPITRTALLGPFVLLAGVIIAGVIVNLEKWSLYPGIFGLRVMLVFVVLFYSLLRLHLPAKFYCTVSTVVLVLMAVQLPLQILQRQGITWVTPPADFITDWDNNAGTFGFNGSLKLGSLGMIALAIAVSNLVIRRRGWLSVLMIPTVPISMAIVEAKYALLLTPFVILWGIRKEWFSGVRSWLRALLIVIIGVGVSAFTILNLTALADINTNWLLGDKLTATWESQFSATPTTTSSLTSGRFGVMAMVADERLRQGSRFLRDLVGNGIGSGSDSSSSQFQGYLFRLFPYDNLVRTDLSRVWIELGWLGGIALVWLCIIILWQGQRVVGLAESEEERLLGYITVSVVPVCVALMPYAPVISGGWAGFMLLFLAAGVETVIWEKRRAPLR
jgi:hypothetical protein